MPIVAYTDSNQDAALYGLARKMAYAMETGAAPMKTAIQNSSGRILFQKLGDVVRALVTAWKFGWVSYPTDVLPDAYPKTPITYLGGTLGGGGQYDYKYPFIKVDLSRGVQTAQLLAAVEPDVEATSLFLAPFAGQKNLVNNYYGEGLCGYTPGPALTCLSKDGPLFLATGYTSSVAKLTGFPLQIYNYTGARYDYRVDFFQQIYSDIALSRTVKKYDSYEQRYYIQETVPYTTPYYSWYSYYDILKFTSRSTDVTFFPSYVTSVQPQRLMWLEESWRRSWNGQTNQPVYLGELTTSASNGSKSSNTLICVAEWDGVDFRVVREIGICSSALSWSYTIEQRTALQPAVDGRVSADGMIVWPPDGAGDLVGAKYISISVGSPALNLLGQGPVMLPDGAMFYWASPYAIDTSQILGGVMVDADLELYFFDGNSPPTAVARSAGRGPAIGMFAATYYARYLPGLTVHPDAEWFQFPFARPLDVGDFSGFGAAYFLRRNHPAQLLLLGSKPPYVLSVKAEDFDYLNSADDPYGQKNTVKQAVIYLLEELTAYLHTNIFFSSRIQQYSTSRYSFNHSNFFYRFVPLSVRTRLLTEIAALVGKQPRRYPTTQEDSIPSLYNPNPPES